MKITRKQAPIKPDLTIEDVKVGQVFTWANGTYLYLKTESGRVALNDGSYLTDKNAPIGGYNNLRVVNVELVVYE